MTFDDIQKANRLIKTTPIKGKEYGEVSERVKAFRSLYPEGSITTEIVSLENGVVVMKATICSDDGAILSTGYAYEKEGSSFINETSFIEVCETSAVGRAIGFLSLTGGDAIASAEEVQNAMLNQKTPAKVSPKKVDPKPLEKEPEVYVPADSIICDDCMHVIKGANGWTPDKIASYSEKRFGRRLCVDCQKREQRKDA